MEPGTPEGIPSQTSFNSFILVLDSEKSVLHLQKLSGFWKWNDVLTLNKTILLIEQVFLEYPWDILQIDMCAYVCLPLVSPQLHQWSLRSSLTFSLQEEHISGHAYVHLCHCCDVLLPSQLCHVPNPGAHQQSEAPAVHHWSEACHRLALQFCLGHGKTTRLLLCHKPPSGL